MTKCGIERFVFEIPKGTQENIVDYIEYKYDRDVDGDEPAASVVM